jgi:hypothetical protein
VGRRGAVEVEEEEVCEMISVRVCRPRRHSRTVGENGAGRQAGVRGRAAASQVHGPHHQLSWRKFVRSGRSTPWGWSLWFATGAPLDRLRVPKP